jgi:hypothetical protein
MGGEAILGSVALTRSDRIAFGILRFLWFRL